MNSSRRRKSTRSERSRVCKPDRWPQLFPRDNFKAKGKKASTCRRFASCATFLPVGHGRSGFLLRVSRPWDSMRRVHGDHMADDQPVKKHPQRRQMLLHRGLENACPPGYGRPNISTCDVGRFQVGQVEQPPALAPIRQSTCSLVICPPRIAVTDARGEETKKRSAAPSRGRHTAGFGASPASESGSLDNDVGRPWIGTSGRLRFETVNNPEELEGRLAERCALPAS